MDKQRLQHLAGVPITESLQGDDPRDVVDHAKKIVGAIHQLASKEWKELSAEEKAEYNKGYHTYLRRSMPIKEEIHDNPDYRAALATLEKELFKSVREVLDGILNGKK